MAFQRALAYRVEYYTGLLNAFLYIFIFTSVWRALIPEGTEANGLTQADMVAYAVLSTLIKVSFGRNDSLLSSRIRSGEIAVDLMKPFNLPLYLFCDTLGLSLFQLLARTFPTLLLCIFLFDITLPIDLNLLAHFLPVYAMSFVLFFSLSFFISTLSFYFVDVFPFWICYFALVTLTSGAIIPLDFFPPYLAKALLYTPFPYLFYFPTMIILQKSVPFAYNVLLLNYLALITITLGMAVSSYRLGLRKLSIAGG